MTERWLPVVGYEDFYEVSDQGRVRRIARGNGTNPGRVLTGSPTPKGHIKVGLSRDGVRAFAYVHRLVLAAFVGPAPEGTEGCHGDGNPENNTVSNLRWDTQSANGLDRVKHGTHHLARRTRCPRGHDFDGERDGYRTCSKCRHINDRARRERARTHQEESMSDQIAPEPSADDEEIDPEMCKGCDEYNWDCRCEDATAEPQGEPSEAQVRIECEYRIRTAVAYGMGVTRRDEISNRRRESWIQEQIEFATAAALRAAPAVTTPQGEPSDAQALETFLGKLAGDGAYTLDFSSAASLHDHIVRLLKRDIAALRSPAVTKQGENTDV